MGHTELVASLPWLPCHRALTSEAAHLGRQMGLQVGGLMPRPCSQLAVAQYWVMTQWFGISVLDDVVPCISQIGELQATKHYHH